MPWLCIHSYLAFYWVASGREQVEVEKEGVDNSNKNGGLYFPSGITGFVCVREKENVLTPTMHDHAYEYTQMYACVWESPKRAASLKFLEGVHSLTNVSIFLCMYVCVYIVVQVSLFSYQIFNNHTCAVCGIYLTIRTILYIEFYYKLIFFEYIP